MYFLARFEETGFSTWLRETGWAFFSTLTLHSLSLGLVVGICVAINLRVLGVGAGIPPLRFAGLLPLQRIGLGAVIVSGSLLLVAYPAKALTNPVFYLKLGCIILALLATRHLFRRWRLVTGPTGVVDERLIAGVSLLLWFIGIGAGRFLAYTNSVLLASSFY